MATGVTAREAFDGTIAANSTLIGDDALPEAIPFDDGVENLLKYAFNMNLGGADVSVVVAEPCDPAVTPQCFGMVEVALP